MALTYTNGSNGIFDILGKLFHEAGQINVCRGTTIPTAQDALGDKYKLDTAATAEMELAFAQLPSVQQQLAALDSCQAILAQIAAGYLRAVVARDAAQSADTIENSLAYLIAQMTADATYVDPNVVGLSLAADAGNSATDLAILYTSKGGKGENRENLLAEVIALDLTSVAAAAATLRAQGKAAVAALAADWPKGSGHNTQLSAVDPAASLLTNGDLNDMAVANIPDDWSLLDGVPGTAYLLTGYEVQQVVIAGSPTSGGYYLQFTSPVGPVHTTTRLAFNADATAVQESLRAIPGLEEITVSSTGTTPNFTHEITFTAVAGNLTTLAALSQLDTGTITPGEVTAGDANAYRGRSLKVVGSAAANRRIMHLLPTLTADTVYFVCLRHKKTGTPAAGTVRVAIVPGFGGTVTQDAAGNSNSTTFDLTTGAVTTSYAAGWLAIRVKGSQAQPLYLEIDVQNLSAGTTYCLDDVVLTTGTQLYAGGPYVAAVLGKTAAAPTDKWTLTATNNRAGSFQEYFARFFDMRSRGLLLPSAGTTNVPDSLIA